MEAPMTRAYIRLDPGFDERKYAYPDNAYAALVATFCLAELQPDRGRFRSTEYLRRLLGKRGKAVPYLLAQGDLTELPDGRVYVDGWDQWQEGDWKVAERVHRIRTRRSNGGDNGLVTVDVTPRRLDSGAVRSEAERSGADGRADLEAYLVVTRRAPTARQRKVLDDYLVLFDDSGPQRAAALILGNPADPIGAVMRDMEAYREERAAEAKAAEAEAVARRREERSKRLTDTQRELMNEWARQQKEPSSGSLDDAAESAGGFVAALKERKSA
jgi:hypothetical protein